MVRILGTAVAGAVFAVCLAASPAAAKTTQGADRNLWTTAETLPVPEFHLIAPDTHVELRASGGAESPVSGDDLKMWLGEGKALKDAVIRRFAKRIINRTSSIAAKLTHNAMRFIGTPYVFGGESSRGFDCSGYVQHVFAMVGVRVPRTADAQFYAAHKIRNGARPGDLVFFQTYAPGPSHVGIYLGGGKFVHAGSSHGVTISRISDRYWANHYLGTKRVL